MRRLGGSVSPESKEIGLQRTAPVGCFFCLILFRPFRRSGRRRHIRNEGGRDHLRTLLAEYRAKQGGGLIVARHVGWAPIGAITC